MSNYKQIAKVLNEKTALLKQRQNNNIFTCYYCPSSHHDLCGHQDKCILHPQIHETLIGIKRTVQKIQYYREQEDLERVNRLVLERKKLFRQYYSINTLTGGFTE